MIANPRPENDDDLRIAPEAGNAVDWVCYFCVKRGKYATTRGQAERAGKAHDRYCPRPRRPEVSRG